MRGVWMSYIKNNRVDPTRRGDPCGRPLPQSGRKTKGDDREGRPYAAMVL